MSIVKSKKVFGIVSYFPDDPKARNCRIARFGHLIAKLYKLWPDVPVMIIAQNWKKYTVRTPGKLMIDRYEDKLGILEARRALRAKFIKSEYDYLIMLDDDGVIRCEDGSHYMEEIDQHPGGVGFFRHTKCPLMLLAISKELYSKIDMPNVRAENNEGFEDDIFVAMCINKFPTKWWDFSHDRIEEVSFEYWGDDTNCCPSTWASAPNRDWDKLNKNTKKILEGLKKK